MIQYYLDIKKQVKAVDEEGLANGQIQKIYSTSTMVSFSIRSPGKTWNLYLGRGGGHEGVWLYDKTVPAELRRKDTFLEYLRKHVSSCGFVGLSMDSEDRIINFQYQKYGQLQSLLFFWMARKLYFIHYYQDRPEGPFKLLLSWHGKAVTPNEDIHDLFEFFNEVGRRPGIQHDLESPRPSTIEEILEEEKKSIQVKDIASTPGFLQRKFENIQSDLIRNRQWEKMQAILDEGRSLENIYELKVGDHKLKFEGELNPFERRNLIFEKIKKLKRGEKILSKRLDETRELMEGSKVSKKVTSEIPIVRPIWGKEEKKAPEEYLTSTKEDFKIFRYDEFSIGVGNSSQGNDQLRNKWAGKEDIWVHLDGGKSAHAIIKLHKGEIVSNEALNLAASILAHFSHVNSDWIQIIFTAVKNLKGVAGAPGMVIYKKEKHLTCPRIVQQQWFKE